jgi:hypothetical protein
MCRLLLGSRVSSPGPYCAGKLVGFHLASLTAAILDRADTTLCTNSIVLLPVEADLSLGEMRCRLREKSLGQEGVALFNLFSLVYMIPASPGKGRRIRSNSLSSASALFDAALVEKIASEEDWARFRALLDGAKLTLRVMDIYS